MDDLRPRGAGARARSPTASIPPPPRPRSSTSCATAARCCSSPRTRSTSTRSCRWRNRCPDCANVVVIDDGAMFDYDHPLLRTYADVLGSSRAARRRRARPPRDAGARRRPRAAGVHRLHLGHDRPSEGRAGIARPAPRRHLQHRHALSDARRGRAPHGRLPAALPRARPRRRHHAAAALAAGAALRRGPRGPAADVLRGRADGDLHRAALSAEVRVAGARRHGGDIDR